MLLISKLHPRLTLNETKDLIKNYPDKNSYQVKGVENGFRLKFKEKVGELITEFEVNFFKGKFATMNGFIPLEICTEDYFNKLKEAYEIIISAVEPEYGKPYSSNNKFKTYGELKAANLSASMNTGRPEDRIEYIMETDWKISNDSAFLRIIIDYFANINMEFHYTVENLFG